MEKTSSAKLDEMLSVQKYAFDRFGLWYDFSSPNIASANTTVFVSPTNNVDYENNDVKTILASENIVSILPLHRRFKGLHKGKVFPRSGRKKA